MARGELCCHGEQQGGLRAAAAVSRQRRRPARPPRLTIVAQRGAPSPARRPRCCYVTKAAATVPLAAANSGNQLIETWVFEWALDRRPAGVPLAARPRMNNLAASRRTHFALSSRAASRAGPDIDHWAIAASSQSPEAIASALPIIAPAASCTPHRVSTGAPALRLHLEASLSTCRVQQLRGTASSTP